MEGREDTDWLFDDIAEDGDGPPSGGKRKLIRRKGFASRISNKDRPHDPGGGGGSIRYPTPRNDMNMNLPMDANKDRYEKPVQTPGWGAEVANPNSITVAQKGMTTAAEVGWNLSDMTEPSRCQETAVAAEGAGTGATMNILDRSSDSNKRDTTGRELATKRDEYMEPIPDQTWPVVPEKPQRMVRK